LVGGKSSTESILVKFLMRAKTLSRDRIHQSDAYDNTFLQQPDYHL